MITDDYHRYNYTYEWMRAANANKRHHWIFLRLPRWTGYAIFRRTPQMNKNEMVAYLLIVFVVVMLIHVTAGRVRRSGQRCVQTAQRIPNRKQANCVAPSVPYIIMRYFLCYDG